MFTEDEDLSDNDGVPAKKRRAAKAAVELEADESGYPLLPKPDDLPRHLPEIKALLRAFITMTYRELPLGLPFRSY